ncbi:MAG TPA: 4a-hydroxytetrahydrobiopterin dehydratase [Candidatus Peribacteraceae bacterium]|nr:4a-hydroxytetrahydrobiopterin dehydratase [Candidatus Peribacteraceae bacterium]
MSTNLLKKKCVPCEGGAQPLSPEDVKKYISEVSEWHADPEVKSIGRQFKFGTFMDAIAFINAVAALAEEENHHPNIHAYYNKVTLNLSTHAIGGLSENDFILAAKIDALNS